MEDQLSIKDIAAAVAIIDAVTKRGAFEGSEIGEVGAVRNRLANFVNAANAQQQAAQEATAEAVEEKEDNE